MANEYSTGALWSNTLPDWQRDYYSLLLLETLRTKSILVPYCAVKRDYAGANSGVIIYTEVMDTEPDWSPLSESDIWLRGAHLDSRTVQIALEIHGDILKFSEYSEVVQYVRKGDIKGLVRDKIGQNQTDYLDILARNAFASHPAKLYAGGAANRAALAADDYFDVSMLETMRIHLEENDVPGVTPVSDNDVQTLVTVTTPRVIKDIRSGLGPNSKWLAAQEYAGSVRLFNGEVGMWDGHRFIRTNRNRLRNAGEVLAQTQLAAATVAGQGAAQTVDTVYTVGQSTSTRYIAVDDVTDFEAGMYITIHDSALGQAVLESDGSQETRRIVSVDGAQNRLVLNKPLLKPHAEDDYVTTGRDVHLSFTLGGPAVVYGIGEDPHPIMPPVIDDLQIIQRYGWRGFLKFQLFRPEYIEVAESAGSTD